MLLPSRRRTRAPHPCDPAPQPLGLASRTARSDVTSAAHSAATGWIQPSRSSAESRSRWRSRWCIGSWWAARFRTKCNCCMRARTCRWRVRTSDGPWGKARCRPGVQVPRLDEIAPEPEAQLGDDTTMDLGPSFVPGCAGAGLDQVEASLPIERHGVEPRRDAASSRPGSELPVQGVARDDLDHARQFQDRRRGAHVPLVEAERARRIRAPLCVRPQSLRRQERREILARHRLPCMLDGEDPGTITGLGHIAGVSSCVVRH